MDEQSVYEPYPYFTYASVLDQDFDNEPLDLEYEHLAQRVEEEIGR